MKYKVGDIIIWHYLIYKVVAQILEINKNRYKYKFIIHQGNIRLEGSILNFDINTIHDNTRLLKEEEKLELL